MSSADRLQCNVWCIAFMDHVKVDEKVCAQVDLACERTQTKPICWTDTSVSLAPCQRSNKAELSAAVSLRTSRAYIFAQFVRKKRHENDNFRRDSADSKEK